MASQQDLTNPHLWHLPQVGKDSKILLLKSSCSKHKPPSVLRSWENFLHAYTLKFLLQESKIPYNSYFHYPASISCSRPDRTNTPENNYFQNIINFLTSLTLSSNSNRKKQFDISLKKEGKKRGGNFPQLSFTCFFFFLLVKVFH